MASCSATEAAVAEALELTVLGAVTETTFEGTGRWAFTGPALEGLEGGGVFSLTEVFLAAALTLPGLAAGLRT